VELVAAHLPLPLAIATIILSYTTALCENREEVAGVCGRMVRYLAEPQHVGASWTVRYDADTVCVETTRHADRAESVSRCVLPLRVFSCELFVPLENSRRYAPTYPDGQCSGILKSRFTYLEDRVPQDWELGLCRRGFGYFSTGHTAWAVTNATLSVEQHTRASSQ
jgi:hypothetical protein